MATPKALRVEQARIEARIKRHLQLEKARERKRDTRRKVLVGALVLGWMAQDEALAAKIYRGLGRLLVRPVDRAVFAGILPDQSRQKAHADG